jgi:hypothetical protein
MTRTTGPRWDGDVVTLSVLFGDCGFFEELAEEGVHDQNTPRGDGSDGDGQDGRMQRRIQR